MPAVGTMVFKNFHLRNYFFRFLLVVVLGLTVSCRQTPEAESVSPYLREAKEVDLRDEKTPAGPAADSPEDIGYTRETVQVPRVQLPPEYQVLQLIDVNLDLDRHEEQILVAQNSDAETMTVRIFVADYDEVRDRYSITWESDTLARQRKGLQVTVMDATGDHNLEIICSGINEENHQTIDLFRRTTSRGEYGLFFASILSLQVPGTIELEETRRSQSYQNGLSNGVSFPIITNSKDTESDRISDIVKRTYLWRNDSGKYELVLENKVSGTEIEDRRLKELFEAGSEEFEEFLQGPWLYLRTERDQTPAGSQALIHFDRKERSITFFSGSVQEIYLWTSSQRFLANSLAVRGENEIIPFMRIHISVYVQDLTHIRLLIYDIDSHNGQRSTNTLWSGVYQKIGESVQRSFLPADFNEQESQSHLPRLTGVYRSDEGYKILFDPPMFSLEEENSTLRGGFSLYNMGNDIMELKVLNSHGIAVERRIFSFDYYEEQKNNEIIRRLFLLPGTLGVHGFRPSSKQLIRYEQIELLEETENGATEGAETD